MPHVLADRVLEASTSAGTGPFTLAGAVLGFRSFGSVCAVADTVPYFIEAVDDQGRTTGDWEFGLGTYSAANQLTRTTVRGSSNAGAAVMFAAGTKLVGLGSPAPNSSATRLEWRNSLGFTAVGNALVTAADAAAARSTLEISSVETGDIVWKARLSTPAGYIKANGTTIGSAASGATGRANADTQALFTLWWNEFPQTTLPIQTSTGAASTRGASAAADWAANKRLPVFDLRGEFPRGLDDGRGVDTGRVGGVAQAGQMPAHSHGNAGDGINVTAGGQGVKYYGDGAQQTGITGGTSNSSENRPRNVAFPYFIKL